MTGGRNNNISALPTHIQAGIASKMNATLDGSDSLRRQRKHHVPATASCCLNPCVFEHDRRTMQISRMVVEHLLQMAKRSESSMTGIDIQHDPATGTPSW